MFGFHNWRASIRSSRFRSSSSALWPPSHAAFIASVSSVLMLLMGDATVDEKCSPGGHENAGEHLHQGRFSDTVRAEKLNQ
jgi:hypothetical protein